MSRKKKAEIEVFQLVTNISAECVQQSSSLNRSNLLLRNILDKRKNAFQESLPQVLPPQRSLDHEIGTEKEAQSPHRPLYQLSPVELEAMKDHARNLLEIGQISPR